MTEVKSRAVKVRNVFLIAGTILAIFVPIWFAAAALGTKFGLWPWTVGLLKMIGAIGVPLIGITIVLTFITSLMVVFIKPRAGYGALAAMWLVSLGAAAIAFNAINSARNVPPIHDISTNTRAPLLPSAQLMQVRGEKSNKIIPPNEATVPFNPARLSNWSGRSLVEIQAEAYPTIQTLTISGQTPAAIYTKLLSSAKAQGLKLISQDAATMRIEATAETFWFGFKDDVILQVTPVANGAQVDMRSISRVGMSDMGANAKRIEALLEALRT